MPDEWQRLLSTANISKTEQQKNPQAILDVLTYFDKSKDPRDTQKFMMSISNDASK